MGKFFTFLVGVVMGVVITYVYMVVLPQYHVRHTKLGFLETRIAGLTSEYMRRSKDFAQTYEDFKVCMAGPACNPREILAQRDKIVAANWPRLFDRLSIYNDWGAAEQSANDRDEFFSYVKEIGSKRLREKCIPKFAFFWFNESRVARAYERGFTCP